MRLKLRYLITAFLIVYGTSLVLALSGRIFAGNTVAFVGAVYAVWLVWQSTKELILRYPEDSARIRYIARWACVISSAIALYHAFMLSRSDATVIGVFVPVLVLFASSLAYSMYEHERN